MTEDAKKIGILRPMLDGDLEMVLAWRNAPIVRKNMYTQQVISLQNHRNWWQNVKDSPRSQYLIFEVDGASIGLVNFTEIDSTHKTATWGFYTGPHAPKGTGTRLGIAALDFAFYSLGLQALDGEVLASNAASLTFHKKLGFHEVAYLAAHKEIDGALQGVYRFALKAEVWPKHRTKLLQQIESRHRDGT